MSLRYYAEGYLTIDPVAVAVAVADAKAHLTGGTGSDELIVTEGEWVNLSGALSSDSDGLLTSYTWLQDTYEDAVYQDGYIGEPPLMTTYRVDITNDTTSEAGFIAPPVEGPTPYLFDLYVTDNHYLSDRDTVTVMVHPLPPPRTSHLR